MLKKHLEGLLGYVLHPITNAVTEGLNSKIQNIKASARGFRSFQRYRIAIFFYCGNKPFSFSALAAAIADQFFQG